MSNLKEVVMQKMYVIPLSLLMLLFSCKTKPTVETLLQKKNIKREIPFTKKGEPAFIYRLYKYQASHLKLDALEVGYDSLQIRIWYDYGLLDVKNVVVIKGGNEQWSAELLTLQFDDNDSSYMRKPILKERINKVPVSGWPSFIKGLSELNITKLPDQAKVAGYKDILGADGVSYNVEVATKEEYRFYSYWQPGAYKKKFKEAMSMESALEFLEKELSFKRLKR
ncbi:MAG: hypothetical protein Q8R50_04760 [Sediminibacterium sp.]|nr:hypothetical protein [Sediminibacterium sp.]